MSETGSAGAFGYLLADLHGNTACAFGASDSISDAFACDAYGNLVASVTSALPTPWRYQGRILESAAGTPDLYDFGSRSYNQTIGTFTSLDTSHGSAQNPALLNGYLYANANPATLVDPDGHTTISEDCALSGGHNCAVKAGNATVEASFQGYLNTQRAVAKASANLPVLCRQTGGHASGCAPLDHHPEKSWSQTMKEGDAAWQAAHPAPVVAAAPTPQAKQRDCGFMGIGCVDLGAAASNVGNTVGSKLQDFGGGVGNWARDLGGSIDRQMPAAVWAFAIGTCALAWETALGCAPLAALAAYTTANGVNNNQTGDGDVLGGWNWKDAALSIPSSLISGGVLPSGRGRFRLGGSSLISLPRRSTIPGPSPTGGTPSIREAAAGFTPCLGSRHSAN